MCLWEGIREQVSVQMLSWLASVSEAKMFMVEWKQGQQELLTESILSEGTWQNTAFVPTEKQPVFQT